MKRNGAFSVPAFRSSILFPSVFPLLEKKRKKYTNGLKKTTTYGTVICHSFINIHLSELAAVSDGNDLPGLTSGAGTVRLNSPDKVSTINNLTKDNVLTIEPRGGNGGDEELGAVGTGTSIGHGEKVGLVVPELEVLISKLLAVDGLATSAVAPGEVTALQHKLRNDTMESRALVMKRLSRLAHTLLTSTESTEVLGSPGSDIGEELKGDTASGLATNGNVKENLTAGHFA